MSKEQAPKNDKEAAISAECNALVKQLQNHEINNAEFRRRVKAILEDLKAKPPKYGDRDVVEYMVNGLREDKESGELDEETFLEIVKDILEMYYNKNGKEKIQ